MEIIMMHGYIKKKEIIAITETAGNIDYSQQLHEFRLVLHKWSIYTNYTYIAAF